MRVTEQARSLNLTSRINKQNSDLSVLKERLVTGKKINRPSDDPQGASAAFNLRTSLNEIAQFKRVAQSANQKLTASDDALSGYQNVLERVRTLVTKGMSDTTTQESRDALATEIEALRGRILTVANTKYGDDYLFGGTRQNAPPFDPTTAVAAATPAAKQYVQIEPGATAVAVGTTADALFADATSTIFEDLTAAVTALRGTGDAAADRATLDNTMIRLNVFSNLAQVAHVEVGVTMNATELVQDRLISDSLSVEMRLDDIEADDFAKSALGLTEAQNALEATLQVAAGNRRSLLDFLG